MTKQNKPKTIEEEIEKRAKEDPVFAAQLPKKPPSAIDELKLLPCLQNSDTRYLTAAILELADRLEALEALTIYQGINQQAVAAQVKPSLPAKSIKQEVADFMGIPLSKVNLPEMGINRTLPDFESFNIELPEDTFKFLNQFREKLVDPNDYYLDFDTVIKCGSTTFVRAKKDGAK